MKPSVRHLLNFLFIAVTLGLILGIAFSNSELTNAWDVLFTLKRPWVIGCLLGWLGYLGFDALSLHFFLRQQGYRMPVWYTIYVALIGFYYGNITPGASGGQPMQIYYMKKREVPIGIGSSAISIKFICTQFMTVALATILGLLNRQFVSQQLGGVKWIILIGYCINAAAVPLVLLVAFHRPLVLGVGNWFIGLGAKLRLVKTPELAKVRYASTLDTFHQSIRAIMKHPGQIVTQLLLAGLSMLSLMAVPVCVYYAFGMEGVPWHRLLSVAFLLFLSASYTPLPGASGAQEGGFLVFYRGLFTQGTIGLALLIWRFFTYYLFLIVGGIASIASNLHSGRKKSPTTQEEKG